MWPVQLLYWFIALLYVSSMETKISSVRDRKSNTSGESLFPVAARLRQQNTSTPNPAPAQHMSVFDNSGMQNFEASDNVRTGPAGSQDNRNKEPAFRNSGAGSEKNGVLHPQWCQCTVRTVWCCTWS
ncbi:uncharacterized protein LOC129593595 [Paramacrobiotus metropolitanus]|uniref:uncharacterized protein LOC129593595 n=1 Tax=Paramacrobiotus metropolitanus TaxID=2943436 RepID=UPI002445A757|nr:uncharacterized protein LOC129593595 [Paramacrobiotus metropolitanus]